MQRIILVFSWPYNIYGTTFFKLSHQDEEHSFLYHLISFASETEISAFFGKNSQPLWQELSHLCVKNFFKIRHKQI